MSFQYHDNQSIYQTTNCKTWYLKLRHRTRCLLYMSTVRRGLLFPLSHTWRLRLTEVTAHNWTETPAKPFPALWHSIFKSLLAVTTYASKDCILYTPDTERQPVVPAQEFSLSRVY